MSIFEHNRWEIFSPAQHPLKHSLSDFGYSNPALPAGSVTNMQGAMDWLFAVLYPQSKTAVADVASLPLVGNTINDYRVVNDDGDGKSAGYRWEQREGEVSPSWHKIYDFDWGVDSILQQFNTQAQALYVFKNGNDDLDGTGTPIAGTFAGQRIYGGISPNTNLTLSANSGDGVGPQTGYVQVTDHFRPTADNTYDFGTATERFKDGYIAGTLTVSTQAIIANLTLSSGSITSASGAISFGDENLSTTGFITAGNLTIASGSITDTSGAISFGDENLSTTGFIQASHVNAAVNPSSFASGTSIGDLTLSNGLITDLSGNISFNDENLSTTGTLSAGDITGTLLTIDSNIRLNNNILSTTQVNSNLILQSNGTGVIDMQSAMTTLGQTVTGVLSVTGQISVDSLLFDGLSIFSSGDLTIDPSTQLVRVDGGIRPQVDNGYDLGQSTFRWQDLFLAGTINDGTLAIDATVLTTLRDINVGVANGMTIFWTGSKWEASLPDTEVDHGTISGLLDDDHTQYALLAGRGGGQTLIGGIAASNDLTLESTSDVTKGFVVFQSSLRPGADNAIDIGSSSFTVRNLYITGQGIGLRAENAATVGVLPAASASNAGRLAWVTGDNDLYVDRGGTWQRVSYEKYTNQDAVNWDGAATSVMYTVSGEISDARFAIWRFYDNTNNFAELFPQIEKTATQITVSFDSPPPAGTYTVVGVS